MYIYELKTWPKFTRDSNQISGPLPAVRHRQGRLIGQMESLGFSLRQEAVLQTLTSDVLKSSEIEGERLDAEQVRSSIAHRLGIDVGALKTRRSQCRRRCRNDARCDKEIRSATDPRKTLRMASILVPHRA